METLLHGTQYREIGELWKNAELKVRYAKLPDENLEVIVQNTHNT